MLDLLRGQFDVVKLMCDETAGWLAHCFPAASSASFALIPHNSLILLRVRDVSSTYDQSLKSDNTSSSLIGAQPTPPLSTRTNYIESGACRRLLFSSDDSSAGKHSQIKRSGRRRMWAVHQAIHPMQDPSRIAQVCGRGFEVAENISDGYGCAKRVNL